LKPVEIAKNTKELYSLLRRAVIQVIPESLSDDELSNRLIGHERVLCVVNTRRHAQELFEKIKNMNAEGLYHLSTTMYPMHRKKVLEEIRDRLTNGLLCRVISTSMIEAGVDVDFPTVYRAEAGLDSVVQSAGRCNREGFLRAEDSIVYIFKSSDYKYPKTIALNIAVASQTMRKHDDIGSPEAIREYFMQLFYSKDPTALDIRNILPMHNDGAKDFSFPFRKISEEFRIIEQNTVNVYALFDAPELYERLKKGGQSRELFRELGFYSVSLYESDIKVLDALGAFDNIDKEVKVLSKNYYDDDYGVKLSPEGGDAIFW
jgi:CRISPR-associated endonuclease/helicase Cas3